MGMCCCSIMCPIGIGVGTTRECTNSHLCHSLLTSRYCCCHDRDEDDENDGRIIGGGDDGFCAKECAGCKDDCRDFCLEENGCARRCCGESFTWTKRGRMGFYGMMIVMGLLFYLPLTVLCSGKWGEGWRPYPTDLKCNELVGEDSDLAEVASQVAMYLGFFAGLLMGWGASGFVIVSCGLSGVLSRSEVGNEETSRQFQEGLLQEEPEEKEEPERPWHEAV